MPAQQLQKTEIPFITKFIATGFFTGYSPFAPGTAGSILGLLIFLIPGFESLIVIIPVIIVVFFIGVITSSSIEKTFGDDPPIVNIDEVVGMWISLIFIPKTIWIIILAFFLFRIFDIVKPFPCRQAEKIKNGWGIMLDDVFAGIYTNLVIQIILTSFNLR